MTDLREDADTKATAEPALAARSITAGYRDLTVLHDVDLEVAPGEWLGLIGPNGAGKSTLLRCLGGMVGHGGTVVGADGAPIAARDVAMVPQNPVLPEGMTVAEYVLLGRTAHLGWLVREGRRDRAVVADVLARMALAPFADRLLTELSGGEAQQVVIARALAQQAPVLLLDEPTSALDLGHQVSVLESVDQLRRADGLSVLSAMHDLTTAARFADRLVLLDGGRVITQGPPSAVLDAELLSAAYGTELTVRRLDGGLVVLPARRR